MSDTMLHGVLNMPLELWADDPMAQAQLHGRCIEASKRIRDLDQKLGLLQIAHDHKATLLESCEKALGERDENQDQLKARVAELEEWIAEDQTGYWGSVQPEAEAILNRTSRDSLAARDARVKANLLGELIDEANNRYTESISLRDLIEMEQEVQEEAERLKKEAKQ